MVTPDTPTIASLGPAPHRQDERLVGDMLRWPQSRVASEG